MDQATPLYESLKKEFGSPKADLSKCGQLLSKLKIHLTKLSFLLPSDKADTKTLLLTREILELGAQWSIKAKDIPSFERYVSQLKTYYIDYSSVLQPSQRMYPILGLNLLRLLAQNRISEFHTELEVIDPEQLGNIYIKHPVQVEQCLMEGSYNKVWNSRSNVPAEEYLFFIDILMGTIRNEIGSCSEKAYESLPLADATTLLYFKSPNEVVAFANERGWVVSDNKIVFARKNSESKEIPTTKLIAQSLGYARELERIATPSRRQQQQPSEEITRIVDQIAALNLLQTASLVSELKSRLNIADVVMSAPATAAASAAAAPAAATEAAPAAEEKAPEKTIFKVKLEKFDAAAKAKIIREIKNLIPGSNLVEAKKFVESVPKVVKENVPKEEAEKMKALLEGLGATVVLE